MLQVRLVKAGSNDTVLKKNRVDDIYAVVKIDGVSRFFYLNKYTLNDKVSYCIELGVDINHDIYNSTSDFSLTNLTIGQINYIKNVSYFGYGYKDHNEIEYYMAAQEIIWEYLSGLSVGWVKGMDETNGTINITKYRTEIVRLVNKQTKKINLDKVYNEGMEVNSGEELSFVDSNKNLENYDVVKSDNYNAFVDNNNLYIKFNESFSGDVEVVLERKKIYGYDSMLYYQGISQKLISNGNVDDKIILKFNIKGNNVNFKLVDSVEILHNNQFDYSGIEFEVYDSNNVLVDSILCDSDGNFSINNLVSGNYYLKQIKTNDAYIESEGIYYFEVDDKNVVQNIEVIPLVTEVELIKFYGDVGNLERENEVIFDIYNKDGTLYKSEVTNEDGIINVDLVYGEYLVKQRNSSVGYEKVDEFWIDARMKRDEKLVYTLVDEAIKVNFSINSLNKMDEYIVEDGISYKIKKDGEYLGVDTFEFENFDGKLLLPFKLGYGDYEIEVINNSNNYTRDDLKFNFVIDDNSNFLFKDNDLYLELNVYYDEIKKDVLVQSYEEIVKYVDNSFYYELVNMGDVNLELFAEDNIAINGEVIYAKNDKVMDVITNNEGKFLIKELYLGSYCLVGDVKVCFEVKNEDEIKIDYVLYLEKNDVNIKNLTSDLDVIMGTSMELLNKDGQVIFIGVTNEEGVIKVSDLAYGKYCLKERSVGSEYLINDEVFCFDVKDKIVELEVVNKKSDKKLISVPNTYSDKRLVEKLVVLVFLMIGGIIYKIKVSRKFN